MITHYLKIAFRNIRKYKVQTIISVCAMAVSLTLLVIVTSLLTRFHGTPLFNMPYFDNVAVYNLTLSKPLRADELDMLMNNNYQHVKKVIACSGSDTPLVHALIRDVDNKEREISSRASYIDAGYLGWMGYRSAVTGKIIADLNEGDAVLSEGVTQKLFGDRNPIGQSLTLWYKTYDENHEEHKNYKELRVADVVQTPALNDLCLNVKDEILVRNGEISGGDFKNTFYFQLDDIKNISSLEEQLKTLLPNYDYRLQSAQVDMGMYQKITTYICKGIFAFLALFLLVSVWSYLRQQTQLFRIRQRELALRTTIGAKPYQAFLLYVTEVVIVMVITVVMSLCISLIIRDVLIDRYFYLMSVIHWEVDKIEVFTISFFCLLVLLSAAVCAVTVWRIRRDQTGLALQMRPRQKHRLRNIGITVQLTISILFTTMIFVFLMSTKSIDNYFGVPENDNSFRRGLYISLQGVSYDKVPPICDGVKKMNNIDKVCCDSRMMTGYDVTEQDYIVYSIYSQTKDEIVDFYDVKIQEPRQVTNPGKSVAVSYAMKDALEKYGVWNDTFLKINGTNYEINGFFDRIPYLKSNLANAVIITDEFGGYYGDLMILPTEGKENEVKVEIDSLLQEIIPERIDITPVNLHVMISPEQNMLDVLKFVVYVLAVISIVTTVATIYSSVSLDTRRRRKEMALRKINGASTRDICRIFAKTYIAVLAFSILISLPIFYVIHIIFREQDIILYSITAYWIAVATVVIITILTIAWKIRDVMHVDPIEYLKE